MRRYRLGCSCLHLLLWDLLRLLQLLLAVRWITIESRSGRRYSDLHLWLLQSLRQCLELWLLQLLSLRKGLLLGLSINRLWIDRLRIHRWAVNRL